MITEPLFPCKKSINFSFSIFINKMYYPPSKSRLFRLRKPLTVSKIFITKQKLIIRTINLLFDSLYCIHKGIKKFSNNNFSCSPKGVGRIENNK